MTVDRPTLHAFLRRLEHEGVLRLDLRATLALEDLLAHMAEDAAAGEPWSRAEQRAAIASLLARDTHEWSAVAVRLEAFFKAPDRYLAGEVDIAAPAPAPDEPAHDAPTPAPVLVASTSAAGRRLRLLRWLRDRATSLGRIFRRRTVLGWLLTLTSLAVVAALLLGGVITARWFGNVFAPGSTEVKTDPERPEPEPQTSDTDTTHFTGTLDPDPTPSTTSTSTADATPSTTDTTTLDTTHSTTAPQTSTGPTTDPSPPPDTNVLHLGPEPNPTTRVAVAVALWLLSLLLAAVGLRWLRAPSLHREEREAEDRQALDLRRQEADDDDADLLTYAVEREPPLPLAAIDDAATILGRIAELTRGHDLDVPATLDATIRAGGRFSPHLAPSRRPLHITVLVDIEAGSHPYLHALVFVLSRWHQLGVRLERYDFQNRPRFVEPRPIDADNDQLRTELTPRLSLNRLAHRSEGAPLLIATRMTTLAEKNGGMPWLRHLGAWPTRALLDLDPSPLAARDTVTHEVADALRKAGVPRFPFTPEGLSALATHLAHGSGIPAPEPELPSWRTVEPALRRWAALASCVPDPTWTQLDAFRRSFAELQRDLPTPQHVQCLLDWLRQQGENPIGPHGRALAISQALVNRLLDELRAAEGLPPGQLSTTERRAREMIIQQLEATTPSSAPMSDRRRMRLAFHHAVLEPARADALLPFFAGAAAPELRKMLAAHLARITPPSGSGWRTLQERLVEGTGGAVPLRHLTRRPWWPHIDPAVLATATATSGLAWSALLLGDPLRTPVAATVGLLGLGGTVLVHRRGQPRPTATPAVSLAEPNVETLRTDATTAHVGQATPPPIATSPRTTLPQHAHGRTGHVDDPPTGHVIGPMSVALRDSAPMLFVALTGGEFTMGSDDAISERPRHRVTLDPFSIATCTVTEFQWCTIMGGDLPDQLGLPKTRISWIDAVEFCNALSEREGLSPCYDIEGNQIRWFRERDGYRLPTEAEWEYATRAGTKTAFSCGEDAALLADHAWFKGNSSMRAHDVGQKQPNPWGLHDVHGNVWEWVWDRYGPYHADPSKNPTGPDGNYPAVADDNFDNNRILRGGAFNLSPLNLRSAFRLWVRPTNRLGDYGLRIARGPHPRI